MLKNDTNGQTRKNGQLPVLNTCQLQFIVPTQKDNANQFNELFTNIGKTVMKNLPAMNPVMPESVVHSMIQCKTSSAEVISIFAPIGEKISLGDDGIHNVLVKLTTSVTVPNLTTLID